MGSLARGAMMRRVSTVFGASICVFLLVVSLAQPTFAIAPENDAVTSPKVFASIPFSDSVDTTDATGDANDPDCFGRSNTVWYRYESPAKQRITANTFGSSYNTNLAAYRLEPPPAGATPSSTPTLSQIACVDNFGGSLQSRLSFDAEEGRVYYFRIGSSSGAGGSLLFDVRPAVPPSNDDIAKAKRIQDLPYQDQVDTTEASVTVSDPECAGKSRTVWYVLKLPRPMKIIADTFRSDYDTSLSVYTRNDSSFNQVTCNNNSGNTDRSKVVFRAEADRNYYLMVSAVGTIGGQMQLRVARAPKPFKMNLSLYQQGYVSTVTGRPVVQGTLTCSRSTSVEVDVNILQRYDGDLHPSSASTTVRCDGVTRWHAEVTRRINARELAVASATAISRSEEKRSSVDIIMEFIGCTLIGTAGRDQLIGFSRNDVLCGLAGRDVLKGRGGKDLLLAGEGDDLVVGGGGDDRLHGSTGSDRLDGGPGVDRCNPGRDKGDRATGCESR